MRHRHFLVVPSQQKPGVGEREREIWEITAWAECAHKHACFVSLYCVKKASQPSRPRGPLNFLIAKLFGYFFVFWNHFWCFGGCLNGENVGRGNTKLICYIRMAFILWGIKNKIILVILRVFYSFVIGRETFGQSPPSCLPFLNSFHIK